MQPQAKVASIDALDRFRASLVLYVDRAGHLLDDVRHELNRTRSWLETDRLPHWKKQRRQREQVLAQAEQELLTARLSEHTEAVRDRRLLVQRAKQSLAEAESSLRRVQRWIGQYDSEIEVLAKSMVSLRHVLDHDLVKASAVLQETIEVLSDYAELSPGRPAESAGGEAQGRTSPNAGVDPAPDAANGGSV